jgi:D-threo-aldose 1-dehydrogenase
MGSLGKIASQKLLGSALDAGITHFDVAPNYGFGAAESCLGEFLGRRSNQVTVTTKFGIPPGTRSQVMSVARFLAGPLVRFVPILKKPLLRVSGSISSPAKRPIFTAAEAEVSLHTSLRRLRREQIDLFLLHEIVSQDMPDDQLLHFLLRARKEGKIRAFGVGSSYPKVIELETTHPEVCSTTQFEWSIMDRPVDLSKTFRIYHRALSTKILRLCEWLMANDSTRHEWSRAIELDLDEPGILVSLAIRAPLALNPGAMLLFSSKNPSHILQNSSLAFDPARDESIRRLSKLLSQSELRHVPN